MVTGGLGVNGAWVVREFVQRGHDVAIVENRDDRALIADVADRVEVVLVDICDVDELTAVTRRIAPDIVVHLAAFVDCERHPLTALAVNVDGTAHVCEAAVAAGVERLVYTSTKGVYAPATGEYGHPTYRPVAEDDLAGPVVMYGITKAAGEDVVGWYGRTTDLTTVSLRFGTIFGPGRLQRHAGAINTYSSMIELPASGEPFSLEHGGDQRDDLVYVVDAADAIVTVALAPELGHQVYNVAAGHTVSIREYADAIRRVLPDAELHIGSGLDPMDQADPYYMALDASRIADDLGWKPSYDIDRAVRHYVDLIEPVA